MANFKRRFFFWVERLNITRGERRFVVTAIVVFLAAWFTDVLITPVHTVDTAAYKPLDSLYQQYVARIHKRDSLIHHYYYTEVDDSENIVSGVPFAIPGDARISRNKKRPTHTRLTNHSIDINRADSTDLIRLPGIGPIIAGKIIDYRMIHGSFSDLKSLENVKGIGKKKFAKIKPYLTLKNQSH